MLAFCKLCTSKLHLYLESHIGQHRITLQEWCQTRFRCLYDSWRIHLNSIRWLMTCTHIEASMRITMGTAVWRIQRRRAGTKKHSPADVLLSWVWMEVVRFVNALRTSATSSLNPETSALSLLESSNSIALTFCLLVISSWKNCLVFESSATKSHLCIWTFIQVNVATLWWHCCQRPFRCLCDP